MSMGISQLIRFLIYQRNSNMHFRDTPKITVAIRKRPLNKKEQQRNESDVVRVGPQGQVVISEYKQKVDLTKYIQESSFNFDFAYNEQANNQQIYQEAIHPLIQNAFMGAKISCFAYGQTGSGKTFTMKGEIEKGMPGLYYLGAKQIFHFLEQPQFQHLNAVVSFYQIYCGKLYDLLNNRNQLKIRQDKNQNINIIGVQEKEICSAQEFLDMIQFGSTFRITSQNATNAESSRSHAILQITLKHGKKGFSKISFIDLAGNQRGADHMDQNKQTKIDGAQINKSLLSLKQCIRALDQGKGHTPFRGSKLTMVLKDSFVGFCNTVMICNVSPNVSASENTMNTLRYADRVKELKRSQPGEMLSKQQLLAREMMLPRGNNKNSIKVNIDRNDDQQDIKVKMDMARQKSNNAQSKQEQMDIQEPNFIKKSSNQPYRKSVNEVKADRRQPSTQAQKASSKDLNTYFKGKDIKAETSKQPLNVKNVPRPQIDQNNFHLANNTLVNNTHTMEPEMPSKRNQAQHNHVKSSPLTLNKSHFQAMSNLRNSFQHYRQNHERFIKEEMLLLKGQMETKDNFRKNGLDVSTYEHQISGVGSYIANMENYVVSKMQLFSNMQKQLEVMKGIVRSAHQLTERVRHQQCQPRAFVPQQQLYPHAHNQPLNTHGHQQQSHPHQQQSHPHQQQSHPHQQQSHPHQQQQVYTVQPAGSSRGWREGAGIPIRPNLGYYGGMGDQQLLEGLSGDEHITRLF